MNKKLLILFLFVSSLVSSQSNKVFIENKGQWDSRIEYNQILPDGNLFLEKDGFTYSLFEKFYIRLLHDDKNAKVPSVIKSHTVKTKFLNANKNVVIQKLDTSSFYYNYFIGDDKSTWQSEVRSTSKVAYQELYPNINLEIYNNYSSTKYDFIVKPNGNPEDIQIEYHGADKVYLEDGKLIVENTINTFEEAKPYSYQIIDGERIEVPCSYKLKGTVLSFSFPEGYDKTKELVIDPVIVFATYSGSTADNFGFTATYDNDENTYAGGIVYGVGVYPVTIGAHQTAWNNTRWFHVDIAISKFNINGTNLLYSTYLGGSQGDAPHSLVVNDQNELYVFGTTGSRDYPTTVGAYDGTFGGGPYVSPRGSGIYYTNGCDIIVTKFNTTGTNLLGSTYVGGTGNDGVNADALLAYNYGDGFRGEIALDSLGNPFISSTTSSADFPVTVGSPQTTYGGGFSDGCVFSLNQNLTNVTWSTFNGGSNSDAAYGIQFDSKGDLFVTGGTISNDLVTTAGAFDQTYNGQEDGFISKYNLGANSLTASTYLGTGSYDQCYFVQLDINDNVYVTGQSLGNYPVTPGTYSNPNSKQFFHKFSNDLSTSIWSTVVGSGRGVVDFSPSAFLVNDCGLIYLSGWGGATNRYFRATGSNTFGLPLTADAYQSTTDSSDFYLMVLDRDATALRYGTYFGGAVSDEHVDGGTSRFDKKGNVYQAICAGCGAHSDLPTTPGAWSATNNSTNCNLGVIKMNISYIQTIAALPVPYLCLPDSVNFVNNSSGGNTYKWYFGDGDSSTLFQPTHVYADTGLYIVTLIVSDSTGCVEPDTSRVSFNAYQPAALALDTVAPICVGDSVQLNSYNGQTYSWTPANSLSSDTIANPIAFPSTTTTYRLISDFYCNSDTVYVTVVVDSLIGTITPDTTICAGTTISLLATGATSYSWYPTTGMTGANTPNPSVTVNSPTWYYVDMISSIGCTYTDSVYVDFYNDTMAISSDTIICLGESATLIGTGGGSYSWSTGATTASTTVSPTQNTTYVLDVVSPNGCLLEDSVRISVNNDPHTISPDTAICLGESATLIASGGGSYNWSNGAITSSTTVTPQITTTYTLQTTSPNGCDLFDTVTVSVNIDTINVMPDTTICVGTAITLSASGGSIYSWSPSVGMNNANSANPTVTVNTPTTYTVNITSAFGCTFIDSVLVDFYNDTMTISPDTSICIGSSAVITGTGGGSYLWSNGAAIASTTVSPTQTTTYVLNVVSPNGCLLEDSVTASVNNDPHTISPDTAICLGESATLIASGGGSYLWSNGQTANSIRVTPNVTTTYTVQTTSPNGCDLFDTVTVTVNIDTINVMPDTTICVGTAISLSASGGSIYSWSPSAGMSNANSANPTVIVNTPTTYTVNITSAFGCTFTDSVLVDFYNDTMTISPDTSICIGNSAVITGTGGGSYLWSTGATTASITVFPTQTTTYVLDVVSPNGCLLEDSVRISVNNDPHTISPDTAICLGESATLIASGGGSYNWSNGAITSSTTVTPQTTTVYSVITTSPNGCDLFDTVTVTVNIDTINVMPDTTICVGTAITLSASGGSIYSWSPSAGMNNANSANPTVIVNTPTTYTVNITSAFGCTFTDSVLVDFYNDTMTISPDTSICIGNSAVITGTGGGSYLWSTGATTASTSVSPTQTTTYVLDVVSPNGCLLEDSVRISVNNDPHTISPDTAICLGESATLIASGGGSYNWSNGAITSSTTVTPQTTTVYSVITTSPNGCDLFDTVIVAVNIDTINVMPDTTICVGTAITLSASGGSIYSWSPSAGMSNANSANPTVIVNTPTTYTVNITSAFGCTFTDSVLVDFYTDTMSISPDTIICIGQPFPLFATGGISYSWSYDPSLSATNIANPIAIPSASTTYYVNATSLNGCDLSDSVSVVFHRDVMTITPDTTICPGTSITLNSTGGGTYTWNASATLVGGNIASPIVSPIVKEIYTVNITSPNGCSLIDSVEVSLHDEPFGTGIDQAICSGDTTQITAFGGGSYLWSPAQSLSSSTSSSPDAFPVFTTSYAVMITTPKGCFKYDTVTINVDTNKIYHTISNDTTICNGFGTVLSATGGNKYSWSPANFVSSPNSAVTFATPFMTTTFYVDISNTCYSVTDSVEVRISGRNAIVIPDKTVCKGEITNIVGYGASSYQWTADPSVISGLNNRIVTVQPYANTTYKLNVVDGFGCKDSTFVNVNLHLDGFIDAGRDQIIELGESAIINATGDAGSILWTPSSTLSCDTCRTSQAFPDATTEYVVELIDTNGCKTHDSVMIEIAGIIWLPNTFTPNGDGVNDKFGAVHENILTYHLEIFNRWGELIYESYDIDNQWDGTYKGKLSQIDSYVWRVTYSHLTQKQKVLMGHVNLVR